MTTEYFIGVNMQKVDDAQVACILVMAWQLLTA